MKTQTLENTEVSFASRAVVRSSLLFYSVLIPWFLVFGISSTLAQRVFLTVDPTSIDENLKFDVNLVPLFSTGQEDINFPPNIVFASDSSKAFVSYSASNKVMVFSPKTGEILDFIEVGANPCLITLTPDERSLAVVSLLLEDNSPQGGDFLGKQLGEVFIIDIETLEIERIPFTKVIFSFPNNVVFSEDGKIGFVASSGTDEILRFDIENGTEITPRLKMPGGTRPSSITMAHNRNFFAVVLVGSSNLETRQIPDSIAFIDTESFVVNNRIPTEVDPGETPHDFRAANTVAFSQDDKFALIADNEHSSASPQPGTFLDHLLVIDVEKGDIQLADVAGVPGVSVLTPQGDSFVVVSELAVSLIQLQTNEECPECEDPLQVSVSSFRPSRSDFHPFSRPAFSQDGSLMFIASPTWDVLNALNLETGEVSHFVEVGGELKRDLQGTEVTLSSAPLDLAMSPDGEVLTALNFNAGTIDLLNETQRFFIPLLLSTPEWFTGVAITNNAPGEAEIILDSFNRAGIQFQDDQITEDIVEFISPEPIWLEARQQSVFTAAELLKPAPTKTIGGWLELDSSQFQIGGVFLTGDVGLKRLDGAPAVFEKSSRVILPEVRVTDGFNTEINVLNPNLNSNLVTITLFNHLGEKLEKMTPDHRIVSRGIFSRLLRDPDPEDEIDEGVFSEDAFTDFVNGYVVITSDTSIVACERYFDSERLAVLSAFSVSDQIVNGATSLYVGQVATFGGMETFLNLIHSGSEEESTVRLTLKDSEGGDLAAPVTLALEPGRAVRDSIANLFNLSDSGTTLSGWISIEADQSGIVGDAEIQAFSGKAMTTIPVHGTLLRNFFFPYIAHSSGWSTGIALLNPGIQVATVRLEVWKPNGELVATRVISVSPGEREVKLLSEFFADLPELLAGYLVVSSDQAILGLELLFSNNLELMSAVAGQVIEIP